MATPRDRPKLEDTPGAWPSTSANSFRQRYLAPDSASDIPKPTEESILDAELNAATTTAHPPSAQRHSSQTPADVRSSSPQYGTKAPDHASDTESSEEALEKAETANEVGTFAPITTNTSSKPKRPNLQARTSSRMTEDDLIKSLSRRRTNQSGRAESFKTEVSVEEEQAEVEKLMSRMFGKNRQANSEDEKTRHVGLVFRNLTVKGMGLGAALQGTLGDPFLALPRLIKALISGGPRKAAGKPPVRTIINDFTGCIKPAEMLLVLGRPGSGCSTFLKVLANQRFGYESIDG